MAAFRIHEDQENRIMRDLRPAKGGQDGQKRAVLGAIDNNKPERQIYEKQIFGQSKLGGSMNVHKFNFKPGSIPTVPVAQFQAFKVYEDTENVLDRHRQRRTKDDLSCIYTGSENDRLVTKREAELKLAEARNAPLTLAVKQESPQAIIQNKAGSPMSIEKSSTTKENSIPNPISVLLEKNKSFRDDFNEIAEYHENIFAYLKERERTHRAKPNYMKKQPDISYSMRTILIDWLVEVTEEYKLHTESLYLAVNYIDRFLSFMSVVRSKLQLVGTAAMFIATKYEEIYPPDVGEFVYITDDTYTKRQMIRMEMLILKVLDFDLSLPTAYTFINAICLYNKLPENVYFLALYLSELSLLEAEPCLETLPSVMASASIALGNYYNSEEEGQVWTSQLEESTGYSLEELIPTMKFLNSLLEKAPAMQQQAIQEKYRQAKYSAVSEVQHKPLAIDDRFDI